MDDGLRFLDKWTDLKCGCSTSSRGWCVISARCGKHLAKAINDLKPTKADLAFWRQRNTGLGPLKGRLK